MSPPAYPVRLGIACGAIGILSSLTAVSQVPGRPPTGIFGVYGQPAPGHDSIAVTQKGDNSVGVNLKLYFANGQTCRLSKDGRWSQDHVSVVADGLDANRPCKLSLFFGDGRVLIKDEGLQCAPVYCGTRGKLDNTSLPKLSPARK